MVVCTFVPRCSVEGDDAVVFKATSPCSRRNMKHMLSCMNMEMATMSIKRRTGPSDGVQLHWAGRQADRQQAYVNILLRRYEHSQYHIISLDVKWVCLLASYTVKRRLPEREFWKCAHCTSQGVIIRSVLKTSPAFVFEQRQHLAI